MTPELTAKLKAKGLKAGEDHMILALEEAIEVGELVVADSENAIDDMIIGILKNFKCELVKIIDKLDGEDNQDC